MADYWKSNERHFCTFCKCWLAGNKLSIQLHESGNHHKGNVKAKLDQVRKSTVEKERQEKELNSTLGQMERAANESYRRDMVANVTANGQTSTETGSDVILPSKLKRPINEPLQVQCKKPKFVLKKPTSKPVYEPIPTATETTTTESPEVTNEAPEEPSDTSVPTNPEGTWYEAKTDTQESFFWNDLTGASSWTSPAVYLSIEEQRARGLKV